MIIAGMFKRRASGGPPIGSLTTWDDAFKSAGAVIAASGTELRQVSSAVSYQSSRSIKPLSGLVYFSGRCETSTANNSGFGVADATAPLTTAGQYLGSSVGIGLWYEGRVYANGSSGASVGVLPSNTDIEVAVRVATRQVWIRRTGQPWIGGGDPAAGTSPTGTVAGSGALYIAGTIDARTGASALIRLPADASGVTGVAPAGFTVGVPA